MTVEHDVESRFGWVMVVFGFLFLSVLFGALASISVFLKPLAAEFSWSRGDTAFAYTAGAIAIGVGGIIMGWVSDRFSTRPVIIFGSIALGLSLVLLSRVQSLWQFYLFYCFLGGFGFSAINIPIISNVGRWFTRNKGLALGIVTAGGAFGQAVIPYLARYLMNFSGWRGSYLIMAGIFPALLLPMAFLIRNPPPLSDGTDKTPGGDIDNFKTDFPIKPALGVAWLSTAIVFCCITMSTLMIHVVALVSDRGIEAQSAAGVLSMVMFAGLAGRIMMGKVADYIGGLRAYMLSSFGQTVMVFWFTQVNSLPEFYVIAVLFGLGFSGVMTSILVCVREMTPPEVGGLSLGIVTFFGWVGMGLGSYQGGLFFDLTGDYVVPYANAAISGIINLGILASLFFYINRRKIALSPA